MINMSYKRIQNLEKTYSETNIAKGERLSDSTKSRIYKNWYDNQKKRLVDTVLNDVKNKEGIREEVHNIVKNVNLNELCRKCSSEVIIAVIILYVQKSRNPAFYVNRTRLWREYGLDWLKYSLILERLVQKSREDKPIRTDVKVDNEKLIRW